MASPTRSSSDGAAAGNAPALWAVVLGVLSAGTLPVAILATRYSGSYELLHAGFAIPVGLALGAAAVALARRARTRDAVTLGRSGGLRAARTGWLLGVLGICLASAGALSLAVYGLLKSVE